MPRCSHKGCNQEFDEADNADGSCIYHPGGPVFHEGLKSWSCCNTVNKPVLEFDEFMKITGCTRGSHSTEPVKEEPSKPTTAIAPEVKMAGSDGKTETYTSSTPQKPAPAIPAAVATPPPPTAPVPEEEDDINAIVPKGTKCRHNGCVVLFVSDDENRKGEGEGATCLYHPAKPIFHEGSKGYLCCKRRVLEFDEFLKIEGCKKGRHVFVPKKSADDKATEEPVNCRIDHYQTPSAVHVSIFAKQADASRSTVKFEQDQIHFDLFLPGSKRFTRSLVLFGPIQAETSTFKFFGTKVECTLKKLDGRSWTLLEKTDQNLGNIALTFGVGGRTGTIGSKEIAR